MDVGVDRRMKRPIKIAAVISTKYKRVFTSGKIDLERRLLVNSYVPDRSKMIAEYPMIVPRRDFVFVSLNLM
jgi:hypothetical protein